jgi:hypothetical protein
MVGQVRKTKQRNEHENAITTEIWQNREHRNYEEEHDKINETGHFPSPASYFAPILVAGK